MEETGINDYAHYTNKDGGSYFLWSFQPENRDRALTPLPRNDLSIIVFRCKS